ncbi:MAG: chaperone NapD [Bacteroidota bacterium]
MPIKSYLVHPQQGKKMEVAKALSNMDQCEVVAAENEELLVLVTDTNSEQEEDILKERLQKVRDIRLMALVSGFNTPKNN